MRKDELQKRDLAIVVSHTHWDREWRYPIWTSRLRLVEFFETLIEVLEEERGFNHMVLDGQTVMVSDYLEIAPANRPRLEKLIREGKIAIGPWYTLPDLNPLSGESLIRNLQKGFAEARSFGSTPTVAYTTFGWGQSSQLPQIYKQFGLEFIITAKHISAERTPAIEFLWEAPDGTQVITSRLGTDARANFYFNTYLPVRYGIEYKSDAYRYRWGRTLVFKDAAKRRGNEDFITLEGSNNYYPDKLEAGLKRSWQAFEGTTVKDVRLMLNGSDSTHVQELLPKIIEEANEIVPTINFVHGTLEDYWSELKGKIDREALKVIKGSLRDGPVTSVTGNALATRVNNKQLNSKTEANLMGVAEPLAVWVNTLGKTGPHSAKFFDLAWDYLLKAHCHDSINGVGQDKNGEDTYYRLRQAGEIGEALVDASVGEIIKGLDTSQYDSDAVLLFVYNHLPAQRSAIVEFVIDMPQEMEPWEIEIVDSSGNVCPTQIVKRGASLAAIDDPDARPWAYSSEKIWGLFRADNLPSYGWELFSVSVKEKFKRNRIWGPSPIIEAPQICPSPTELSNDFLAVSINPNGTIKLFDKENNRLYDNLLSFEDTGDVGDYWIYSAPYGADAISSLGCSSQIKLLKNGPLSGSIEVKVKLSVPKEAVIYHDGLTNEGERGSEFIDLEITNVLTLNKGERFLRVDTKVENCAKDHRMRLKFPLGYKGEHSSTLSHFYVEKRPVGPSEIPGGKRGYWPEMQTHPMQHFVDVEGEEYGLALLSNSFYEFEVVEGEREDTLVLTAFRSVRNKICTEFRTYTYHKGQEGGQQLGPINFSYALFPHRREEELFKEADQFLASPLVYQCSAKSQGQLPVKHSMGALDNHKVRVSALRPAREKEGFVLRLWNSSDTPEICSYSGSQPFKEAYYLTIDEQEIVKEAEIEGASVKIELPPHSIITLYIH